MPYVPLRWLAEHVAVPDAATADDVAADLVRVGLEEEAVHGPAVTGPLVVGRVLSVEPEQQKNGKTINWCQVDVGENTGPRGIVCGAHNFGVGDHVVVALPGAVLPGPFPITARKTYGHVSDGMIASARELGIGEDHTGILVLAPEQVAGIGPGDDAVVLLGLDESVVEINVTPDRGYCFSMRGVAREYGHATGAAFADPGLPRPGESLPVPGEAGFAVELSDVSPIHGRAGCDRFVARVVRGVDAAAPSPAWLQRRLTQAGMRPISLAVDITNYVMLDLGQPLHAYDLSTLVAPIVVRRARGSERLRTLDDADRALDVEDLLITDSHGGHGNRVLGLAGVMGGADTEVTQGTSDLLIEAAHFDQISVARTARRHKLPSEAAKRFERGVDPRLPDIAAQRVVELLVEFGGGRADPHVTDVDATTAPAAVEMAESAPAALVGVAYTSAEVRWALTEIGCAVAVAEVEGAATATRGPLLHVTPPSWRPDLAEPADLVEEVARLHGYDRIGQVLPPTPAGSGLTPHQRRRRAVARALAGAGYVEVLSYPFIGSVHDTFGLPSDDPRRAVVTLANPLSAEEPALRTSVLDTLVQVARRNVGRGLGDLAVFELGLVPAPRTSPAGSPVPELPAVGVRPTDEVLAAIHASVPDQHWHAAGVVTGKRELPGVWGPGRPATWADAVEAVRTLARAVQVDIVAASAALAPWHPGRCAELRAASADGPVIGHAGELHPAVASALELPARSVAFEVDLDALIAAGPSAAIAAEPVSVYPPAKEDVALVVDSAVPASEVLAAVREGAGELAEDIRLFDVYTGDQVGEGRKSLAFALRLRAPDRTLTAAETAAVREAIVAAATRRFGGALRA